MSIRTSRCRRESSVPRYARVTTADAAAACRRPTGTMSAGLKPVRIGETFAGLMPCAQMSRFMRSLCTKTWSLRREYPLVQEPARQHASDPRQDGISSRRVARSLEVHFRDGKRQPENELHLATLEQQRSDRRDQELVADQHRVVTRTSARVSATAGHDGARASACASDAKTHRRCRSAPPRVSARTSHGALSERAHLLPASPDRFRALGPAALARIAR